MRQVLLSITLVFLAGCGGGGGGGGSSSTANLTISGTAATGAALQDATVVVVDALGISEVCGSKTDSSGSYSCPLYKAKSAPFMMQATLGSTKVHAVVPEATNQTINITPVSELMAQKYASNLSISASEMMSRPETAALVPNAKTQASNAIDVVKAVVTQVLQTTGGNVTIEDPLTGNLKAGNSSDNFDKVLATMKFAASASEFKIYIPASNGELVTVTVEYSKSKDTAKSETATKVAGKSVSLNQGQSFEAAVKEIISLINTGTAAQLAAKVGYEYDQGRTPAQWANKVVNEWRAGFGTLTVKSISKVAIEPMTNAWVGRVEVQSSLGGVTQFMLALKDVSTTGTPDWRMVGDEMRVDMGLELRHELRLRNSGSSKGDYTLYFNRKFNTYLNNDSSVISVQPDRLLVSILKMEDIYTSSTPVDFTLYKPSSQTCSGQYSASATTCQDLDVLESSDIFKLMSSNVSKIVVKAMTGNNCVNCNSSGIPKSMLPGQKAFSTAQLLGPTNTEAVMRSSGLATVDSATENYIRTYFALPSRADITSLQAFSVSTNPATDLSVNWVRPTSSSYVQIDGLWAGTVPCAVNSSYANFTNVNEMWAKSSNSHSWTNVGSTVNKSSWFSVGFNSKVADGIFMFELGTGRSCTN